MDLDEKAERSPEKIGMIFQHFNLMRSRTVYQNIEFPLKRRNLRRMRGKRKIASLLELVGLTDKRDAYPSQLPADRNRELPLQEP